MIGRLLMLTMLVVSFVSISVKETYTNTEYKFSMIFPSTDITRAQVKPTSTIDPIGVISWSAFDDTKDFMGQVEVAGYPNLSKMIIDRAFLREQVAVFTQDGTSMTLVGEPVDEHFHGYQAVSFHVTIPIKDNNVVSGIVKLIYIPAMNRFYVVDAMAIIDGHDKEHQKQAMLDSFRLDIKDSDDEQTFAQ